MTEIKSRLNNILEPFVQLTVVVFCVIFLACIISKISIIMASWISSDENSSAFLNLSINSLLVSVTSIYVLFTYSILSKNKESIKQNQLSIEQNQLSIEQNERIYKRRIIEEKLEKFYYPLEDLLKSQFEITDTKNHKDGTEKTIPVMRIKVDFKNPDIKKSTGLSDIISHQYLAEDGVDELLSSLLRLIYNSASSTDKGLIHYYEKLVSAVNSDIDNLLVELRNI